jgi:DNA-binding MarR family transcriptional regulator
MSSTGSTQELTYPEFQTLVATLYNGPSQPSVGGIAKQLGVGYSMVYRALKRGGIKRRRQGPPRTDFLKGSKSDHVAQLLVTNHGLRPGDVGWMSQQDIADQVGCTRQLVKEVYSKMKERGLVNVTWRTT